jgi:peptide/nickel transport system permease protein
MGAYIVRRLIWAVFVVLIVTLITYFIFFIMPPGDPTLRFAGRSPTPETLAAVRERFGLDGAWYQQFATFVKRVFTGDEWGWPGLGFSYDTRVSVRDELIDRLPRTLFLAFGAAIVWAVMGVAIGVISAIKRGSVLDRAAMGFALFGVSAPVFWLGLVALWVFWEKLGILPGTGYVPFSENPKDWFLHMILPCLVLALLYAAFYARITRGNLLETMGEDYIRTARAKGLSERKVIMKHGLRASLTPVVTMFGMDIALLIGGAVIVETVFNWQGAGSWVIRATFTGNLPVVVAVVLMGAIAVVILNLIVDIFYAYLDPRVRYQ